MISYIDRSSLSIFQFYYDLLTAFDADSDKSVMGLTFSGVAFVQST